MRLKRWLTALLLALICSVQPALAEDDPALVDRLCGGWSIQDPTAEFAGIYFCMDGVCLMYDTLLSGEETSPRQGKWHINDGNIDVSVEGDPLRYRCRLIPTETWEGQVLQYALEVKGVNAVQYERGGVTVSWEDVVPEEVQQDMAARYPGMEYEGSTPLPDTPDGMHYFVLLKDQAERRLLGYRYTDGAWTLMVDTRDGVPQNSLQAWISHRPRDVLYLNLMTDDKSGHDGLYYTAHGGNISIETANEESYVDTVTYMWHQDTYHLVQYTKNIQRFVDVVGDVMVYTNLGNGYDGTVKCTIETAIDRVNFIQLPESLEEYDDANEGLPLFDRLDEHSLIPWDVTFPADRKCPVYTGPGTDYERAAGGKAAVSTNGWIQVFCEYNGMWLIQYELDEGKYRMGWIEIVQDASWRYIPKLDFAYGYQIRTVNGPFSLTDDPMGTGTQTVQLDGQARLCVMGKLNADWLYVRAETDTGAHWGFLPADVL